MMANRNLTRRLALTTTLGVMVAVILPVLTLNHLHFTHGNNTAIVDKLQEQLDTLENGLRHDDKGQLVVQQSPRLRDGYAAMTQDMAYEVLDSQGRQLSRSPDGTALVTLRTYAGPDGVTAADASAIQPLRTWLAQRTVNVDGQRLVLRAALSERIVTGLRLFANRLYREATVVTVLLSCLVFMAIAYLTVTRMLRPLHAASEQVRRIGPDNLSARVPEQTMPQELQPLIHALNGALDRLEHGYQVQKEFLASAAHELKTPLSLLHTELQLSGLPASQGMLEDVQLMTRQVNQLLHLAEASEQHNFNRKPLLLDEPIEAALGYMARMADSKAIQLDFRRIQPLPGQVQADHGAVFILIRNLLENAVMYSPHGSCVAVELTATDIRIRDQGPGIASEYREKIFQRFWRPPGSRGGGAGLGLSICMAICRGHGWQLTLQDNAAQAGCCFHIQLASPALP